jgi:hypothetical protein
VADGASVVRKLARGAACWAGAVVLIAAGFFIPLYVAFHVTYSLVVASFGPPNHDLSDIGPGIIGFFVGGFVALIAASVGGALASFPALALIGKSGLLDRFRRRRTENDLHAAPTETNANPTEDTWPR